MLRRLEIQNYAIIDQLEIAFPAGLAIITGETGAGKSILLGALGLVLGKRADTKVMYNPEKKCYVEAVFDISALDLASFFTEEGLEYDNELIIRRELSPGGKSRAFLNDSPVTLDILEQISSQLLDVHQQFDTQDIQKSHFQLAVIDALAGIKKEVQAYTTEFVKYRSSVRRLEDLKEKNRNAAQEIEFLSFQVNEFTEAGFRENEQEELETILEKLTAAEDIKRVCTLMVHNISEDEQAILSQIQLLAGQLSSVSHFDQAYNLLHSRLVSAKEELQDISRECMRIADNTEYDAEAIHEINARLSLIYRLQKKHQVATMSELLGVQAALQAKMEGFGDLTGLILSLEKECTQMEETLRKQAVEISTARQRIFTGFEQQVHGLLVSLSMEHAYIQVQCTQTENLTKSGTDDISILFSPNKGSAYLPLKDTASGGELSRLALCIKSLVAGAMTLPTLIFDEVDAGVSGEVARKMGTILHALSGRHQVICITHSPQVAARAEKHFWVYKEDTPTRTLTALRELSQEERTIEIAKMLSGNPPSDAALANARELMAK